MTWVIGQINTTTRQLQWALLRVIRVFVTLFPVTVFITYGHNLSGTLIAGSVIVWVKRVNLLQMQRRTVTAMTRPIQATVIEKTLPTAMTASGSHCSSQGRRGQLGQLRPKAKALLFMRCQVAQSFLVVVLGTLLITHFFRHSGLSITMTFSCSKNQLFLSPSWLIRCLQCSKM